MIVAIELASNMGEVGYYGRQLSQIDVMETDGEILQHRGVLMFGVNLHTRFVIGNEVNLRLDFLVLGEEDVVVFIQREFLVADGRPVGHKPEAQTFVLHLCRRSYPDTCQSTVLVDMAVDEGVEHELRIALVVTYLSLIGQTLAFLCEVQVDGVDTDAVIGQGVDMTLAVDARLCRGGHVDAHLLEIYAEGSQHVGHGVVTFAL